MNIIKTRKTWFVLSGILVAVAIVLLIVFGLNLGIDFTGGVVAEYEFNEIERPELSEFDQTLGDLGITDYKTQFSGDQGVILKVQEMSGEMRESILKQLNGGDISTNESIEEIEGEGTIATQELDTSKVEEVRFESIGPVIGQELKTKSIWSIIVVVIVIVLYIAFAFRKVSYPVPSWQYGIAAIVALVHDVIIALGIFAVLGHYWGIEINSLFIVALLTILGYSVNDTIVVFDKVRDAVLKHEDFDQAVDMGLRQTIVRSLNTSITTFLVLSAIFFFGGATIKPFIFVLTIGVVVGTYSSIFVAGPLLVWFRKLGKKIK